MQKTVLCATLYQMLATDENFNCIFLTATSCELNEPLCTSYFNAFIAKHKDCLKENKIEIPGNKENHTKTLEVLIHRVKTMKNINLFLDLSLITQNIKNIECLISIALTFLPESSAQLLISTSSGAKHMFGVGNPTLLNSWQTSTRGVKNL